jgi:hypothetical protein
MRGDPCGREAGVICGPVVWPQVEARKVNRWQRTLRHKVLAYL